MDKALQTQLANIEKRTGKSIDELGKLVKASGHTKHGAIRDWLKQELGMGHGDANTLVHVVLQSSPVTADVPEGDAAASDRIYAGAKAGLRPIHEAVMKEVSRFGSFEIAPKKTYLSLRRKKQFAMVGPATNTRVDVGLNMKGVKGTGRLEALPPGGMCQYRVKLTSADEVDKELTAWIRKAYDESE
jgi:Domain of unknown function (DUF5655)/Domain of unknown function (DUF4287)